MTEKKCSTCKHEYNPGSLYPCSACARYSDSPQWEPADPEKQSTVSTQPHYMNLGIQPIEFMAKNMKPDEFIGHMKGCVTKYLYRQKESEIEDYEKASQYASWLAEYAKKGGITIPGKGFVEGRK